ncbi:hypothetical protein MauCBS54593_002387 [Microsporum audouinii]
MASRNGEASKEAREEETREPSVEAGGETKTAEVKVAVRPRKGIVSIASFLQVLFSSSNNKITATPEFRADIYLYLIVGCLMLFVGDHEDKGEDTDYWRVRLGWSGDEEPRDVYHRYEAVGDPTQAGGDGQVPLLRFEKERQAAASAAANAARTGRGGYRRARAQPVAPDAAPGAGRQDAAEGAGAGGAVEGGDGAGHLPPETEVKKRGRNPAVAKVPPKRKRGQDDGDDQPAEQAVKRRAKAARK